jgi:DNA-binding transcriptional MerR regulator
VTTELWTLPELADRVAAALSSGYDGQVNGRVTEVPDIRTIRYYTTLGLLDRPTAMRGRTALYAPRHVWQLVAIKRLQADGRTLAEIQGELTGASDATLRSIAGAPANEFWRRAPASTRPEPVRSVPAATVPATDIYQAVPLDSGAVVLIPHRAPLGDRDIAALRAAARALDEAVGRLPEGTS